MASPKVVGLLVLSNKESRCGEGVANGCYDERGGTMQGKHGVTRCWKDKGGATMLEKGHISPFIVLIVSMGFRKQ